MEESPIRILIEVEGIEPSDRFRDAVSELAAATTQLLGDTAEVTGYAYDLNPNDVNFKAVAPNVLAFNIGMPPTFKASR